MTTLVGEEWRDHDFTGRSVAVVVPAGEAARIVPAVVGTARAVKVFQHEPSWVVPVPLPSPVLARLHLRLSVRDPWTRRLLTPSRFDHEIVVSSAYYRALRQPHCKLIAWPVYAVLPHGIRTAEGIEHRTDVIILSNTVRQELAA